MLSRPFAEQFQKALNLAAKDPSPLWGTPSRHQKRKVCTVMPCVICLDLGLPLTAAHSA